MEGQDLVEDAVVAGDSVFGLRRQRRVSDVSEGPEPVVDRHQDDALARQRRSVVDRQRARAAGERAAVDPDHHRQAVVLRLCRGPDVEVEAVLAHFAHGLGVEAAFPVGRLHARGRLDERVVGRSPGCDGLGWPESEVALRRLGVRDAEIGVEPAIVLGDEAHHVAGRSQLDRRQAGALGAGGGCKEDAGKRPTEATTSERNHGPILLHSATAYDVSDSWSRM